MYIIDLNANIQYSLIVEIIIYTCNLMSYQKNNLLIK